MVKEHVVGTENKKEWRMVVEWIKLSIFNLFDIAKLISYI